MNYLINPLCTTILSIRIVLQSKNDLCSCSKSREAVALSTSSSWPLILCTFKLQDLLIVLIERHLGHSLINTSVSSRFIW